MFRRLESIRWLGAVIVFCAVTAWAVFPPGMCLMEFAGDSCACCGDGPAACNGKCCQEKPKPANHGSASDCGGSVSVCFSTPQGTSLMPRDTENPVPASVAILAVVAILPVACDPFFSVRHAGPAPPLLHPPPPSVLRI